MGNRVGLTVGQDEYSFVYNPVAWVPAVIVESGPDKTCYYFRDPDGVLIARFDTDPQRRPVAVLPLRRAWFDSASDR